MLEKYTNYLHIFSMCIYSSNIMKRSLVKTMCLQVVPVNQYGFK